MPDASRDGVCALIDQAMAVIKKDSRAIVGLAQKARNGGIENCTHAVMLSAVGVSMSSTRVSRHVNAPRAIVYHALLDAHAVATWMVPNGMTSQVHAFEPPEAARFGSRSHTMNRREPARRPRMPTPTTVAS